MLRVDLAPSRVWASVIGLAHALALTILALSGAPASIVAGMAVCIAAHAIHRIRRDALLATPRAIVALELGAGLSCALIARDGTRIEGRISAATRVTARLVIVGVRARPWHRSHNVAIVAGMAPNDALRALRVRLRWDTSPSR
jgi:hypothetical protein